MGSILVLLIPFLSWEEQDLEKSLVLGILLSMETGQGLVSLEVRDLGTALKPALEGGMRGATSRKNLERRGPRWPQIGWQIPEFPLPPPAPRLTSSRSLPSQKNQGFADRPSLERGLNPIPEDLWWLRAEFQANTSTFPRADVVDPSLRKNWREQGEIFPPKPGEKSGNNREGIVASLQVVVGTEVPVKMDLLQYLGFMTNLPSNEFIPRRIRWWPDLFQRPPWILDFCIPGMRNGPKSMDGYC